MQEEYSKVRHISYSKKAVLHCRVIGPEKIAPEIG